MTTLSSNTLILNKDSTFLEVFGMDFGTWQIAGSWTVQGNKLLLTADSTSTEFQRFTGDWYVDAYTISGTRLYSSNRTMKKVRRIDYNFK